LSVFSAPAPSLTTHTLRCSDRAASTRTETRQPRAPCMRLISP
jgi:hypothetical protein